MSRRRGAAQACTCTMPPQLDGNVIRTTDEPGVILFDDGVEPGLIRRNGRDWLLTN